MNPSNRVSCRWGSLERQEEGRSNKRTSLEGAHDGGLGLRVAALDAAALRPQRAAVEGGYGALGAQRQHGPLVAVVLPPLVLLRRERRLGRRRRRRPCRRRRRFAALRLGRRSAHLFRTETKKTNIDVQSANLVFL